MPASAAPPPSLPAAEVGLPASGSLMGRPEGGEGWLVPVSGAPQARASCSGSRRWAVWAPATTLWEPLGLLCKCRCVQSQCAAAAVAAIAAPFVHLGSHMWHGWLSAT